MNVLKSSLNAGLPIVAFLAVAVSTLLLLRLNSPVPIRENTKSIIPHNAVVKEPEVIVPGLPVRLKIPKINVDAAIEGLGLTPQGDLEAPKGTGNTGWYNAGPRPGGLGSAVIDGHFGLADNKPAVFDNLHTLTKGDTLYIEDTKGDTYRFAVSDLKLYNPDDDASAVFRSSDGRARLNLITCQGTWNNSRESYATRLVVFADMLVD